MSSQFVALRRLLATSQQQSGKVVSSSSKGTVVATANGTQVVRSSGVNYSVGQSVVVSGGGIASARKRPETDLPVFIV